MSSNGNNSNSSNNSNGYALLFLGIIIALILFGLQCGLSQNFCVSFGSSVEAISGDNPQAIGCFEVFIEIIIIILIAVGVMMISKK